MFKLSLIFQQPSVLRLIDQLLNSKITIASFVRNRKVYFIKFAKKNIYLDIVMNAYYKQINV